MNVNYHSVYCYCTVYNFLRLKLYLLTTLYYYHMYLFHLSKRRYNRINLICKYRYSITFLKNVLTILILNLTVPINLFNKNSYEKK